MIESVPNSVNKQENDLSFTSLHSFLNYCVKRRKIPVDFIKSKEFEALIRKGNLKKDKGYEALFYSRDDELRIDLSRESGRIYTVSPSIFETSHYSEQDKTANVLKKFNLGIGSEDFTFLSRDSSDSPNVRGTKLVALSKHEENSGRKVNADLISSRHTLVELLALPFKTSNFSHTVVGYDGQIFIESNKKKSSNIDPDTMTGYNFETLMTRSKTDCKSDAWTYTPSKNNAVKYNTLVLHRFKPGPDVLVSCEVDAIKLNKFMLEESATMDYLDQYVELKCRKTKLAKNLTTAYIQCYLSETRFLVVGYRDKNNYLKSIEEIDVFSKITCSDSKLSTEFLNGWFWFITSFIKRCIGVHRKMSTTCMTLSYHKNKKNVSIYYSRPPPSVIEACLSSDFIAWRKKLRNGIDINLKQYDNDLSLNSCLDNGETRFLKDDFFSQNRKDNSSKVQEEVYDSSNNSTAKEYKEETKMSEIISETRKLNLSDRYTH